MERVRILARLRTKSSRKHRSRQALDEEEDESESAWEEECSSQHGDYENAAEAFRAWGYTPISAAPPTNQPLYDLQSHEIFLVRQRK